MLSYSNPDIRPMEKKIMPFLFTLNIGTLQRKCLEQNSLCQWYHLLNIATCPLTIYLKENSMMPFLLLYLPENKREKSKKKWKTQRHVQCITAFLLPSLPYTIQFSSSLTSTIYSDVLNQITLLLFIGKTFNKVIQYTILFIFIRIHPWCTVCLSVCVCFGSSLIHIINSKSTFQVAALN